MRRNKNGYKQIKKVTKSFLCLLVRMRSPNHSLKDMETGTAPTRHFLTPTRATQRKRKKQEAEPRPPVFSCFPIASTTSPTKKPHVPGRICESVAARIQAPATPTGSSCPIPQPIGGGIATARTKPLAPPYAKLPTTAHVPPVAGHSAADATTTPFYQQENGCAILFILFGKITE